MKMTSGEIERVLVQECLLRPSSLPTVYSDSNFLKLVHFHNHLSKMTYFVFSIQYSE